MRLGAGLRAGAFSRSGADQVQVLHGGAGIAELVLRLGVDQERLGVAVQGDVHVSQPPGRAVVALAVLVRHRPVAERVLADRQPAAAGDIRRVGLVALKAP